MRVRKNLKQVYLVSGIKQQQRRDELKDIFAGACQTATLVYCTCVPSIIARATASRNNIPCCGPSSYHKSPHCSCSRYQLLRSLTMRLQQNSEEFFSKGTDLAFSKVQKKNKRKLALQEVLPSRGYTRIESKKYATADPEKLALQKIESIAK